MAARIIAVSFGLLCLLLGIVHTQDTSGFQNAVTKHHGTHMAISRLEQNINHEMREMERRLLFKLHDKFRKLNVSSEIEHIENLFDFQYEEFSLFRENERLQQKEIVALRTHVAQQKDKLIKQHKEINAIKTSLAEMTSLTRDLNAKLEALMTSDPASIVKPTGSSPVKPKPIGRKIPSR